MKDGVLIKNKLRVARKLGVSGAISGDSAEFLEFQKANQKYFETLDKELLQEFYEKTGLILAHLVRKNMQDEWIFTMHGWSQGGDRSMPWAGRVHDEHILVVSEGEPSVGLDDTEIMQVSEAGFRKNYEIFTEKERRAEVKQEFYDVFGAHFVLRENGELYRDEKLYDEGVAGIFMENSATHYIVFEDNRVEMLNDYGDWDSADLVGAERYKQVVFDANFLAMLKDGGEGELYLVTVDDFQPDTSVAQTYLNVGVIKLEYVNEEVEGDPFGPKLFLQPIDGKEIQLYGAPIVRAPFVDEE